MRGIFSTQLSRRRALASWTGLALAMLSGSLPSALFAAEPTGPSRVPSADLSGVTDLSGQPLDPFADPAAKAVVLIFVSIECPICNRYAPEIQRLQARFSKQGVVFWLVQPTTDESTTKTRQHLRDFGYSFGLLRDPKLALVKLADAKITPEAAVFLPGRKLVYHGRIDNRYADYGQTRPAPTQRELNAVLEDVLAGRTVSVANTPAVGCYIPR